MKFQDYHYSKKGLSNNSFTGGSSLVGNGFCDDGLNKIECLFDGGDCCPPRSNTDFCTLCQCHNSSCDHWSLVGDGVCDDMANIMECNFDGGDCCAPDANTDYCTFCQCHNSSSDSSTISPLPTSAYPTTTSNSSHGMQMRNLTKVWKTESSRLPRKI